ncbi:hypothetical protein GGI21_000940 [Coemansia aciculifera]|nr:hypothetical protein GGI21_000940 [Coemansia aciculifera]
MSSGFRAVTYPCFHCIFKLELASSPTYINTARKADPKLPDVGYRLNNYLGYPTYHLAKLLLVELDERAIYSGEAVKLMNRPPFGGSAFKSVRKIEFDVFLEPQHSDSSKKVSVDQSSSNIAAFVQHIKLMSPKIHEIDMQPIQPTSHAKTVNPCFDFLVGQLQQLVGQDNLSICS